MALQCRIWFTDGTSDDMILEKRSLWGNGKRFDWYYQAKSSVEVREYIIADTNFIGKFELHPQVGTTRLMNGDSLRWSVVTTDDWGNNW